MPDRLARADLKIAARLEADADSPRGFSSYLVRRHNAQMAPELALDASPPPKSLEAADALTLRGIPAIGRAGSPARCASRSLMILFGAEGNGRVAY
jgi:hypothetical protein